jgi:biopolymer transport protein ExbB
MLELMQRGGPALWLILATSALALAIFLERLLHLHRAQIKTGDFLAGIFNILQKGNLVEAVSICDETPGPVAQMVRAAILEHQKSPERVRQSMEEAGLAEIPRLEKNLPMLLTLAQITPMFGLLGTVLGMMQILLVIQQKAPLVLIGDLGGGLWQALLSTAAGLSVAIPAYAGYNLLVSRVEAIVLDMERAFGDVLYFLGRLGGSTGS